MLFGADHIAHLQERVLANVTAQEFPGIGWPSRTEVAEAVARFDASAPEPEEQSSLVRDLRQVFDRAVKHNLDLQVVASMVDHGLNPQAALDAPRWRVERNGDVLVEPQTPESVVAELRRRGHTVRVTADGSPYGRGQIIVRDEHGVMVGGTEPLADGVVAAR